MPNTASGGDDLPVITSITLAPVTGSTPVGSTFDLTATVYDQDSEGVPNFPGSVSPSSGVATVALIGPNTNASGQVVVRVTGVAPGNIAVAYTGDGVISNGSSIAVISTVTNGFATATFLQNGAPFGNQSLKYWIISTAGALITSGTQTTSANGTMSVAVDLNLIGQKVLIVVNNLGGDFATAGKIHNQQVVTVA